MIVFFKLKDKIDVPLKMIDKLWSILVDICFLTYSFDDKLQEHVEARGLQYLKV